MVFPPPENVAVYGTLKHGESNHTLLSRSQFLGSDRISGLALYHLGAYPGAVWEAGAQTEVEVYQVCGKTLQTLDKLEDFDPTRPRQSLYLRKAVETRFGRTWLYLYNRPVNGKARLDTSWVGP